MSKTLPVARDALEQWLIDEGVVDGVNRLSNDEKAVVLQLKIMLAADDLRSLLSVEKIERYRFEFSVQDGRIDLLLFHADGGVSIVEAKPDTNPVSVAAGIGQLCYYAAALPSKYPKGKQPAYINRFLCAPVKPERSLVLMAACEMAGVKFVHLAPIAVFKARIDALKNKST
jgi:hypothetical protein